MANDFDASDVLAWARTKPADEAYCYNSNGLCAIAQFLLATGRATKPNVGAIPICDWDDLDNPEARNIPFPEELDRAVSAEPHNYGALVKRLELIVTPSSRRSPYALRNPSPDTGARKSGTPVAPSPWTSPSAYEGVNVGEIA